MTPRPAGHRRPAQPGITQPSTARTGTIGADAAGTGAAQPGTTQPGTAQDRRARTGAGGAAVNDSAMGGSADEGRRSGRAGAAALDMHPGDAHLQVPLDPDPDPALGRVTGPPDWLRARLFAVLDTLADPPRPDAAIAAIAARHQRAPGEVLLTSGTADAFSLIAQALPPRRAVWVGPADAAAGRLLRQAGHDVRRLVLTAPALDLGHVPRDADLVVVASPASPASAPHPARALERLAAPGRILVIDETHADSVPGDHASLAARRDLPGLVVIRGLARAWGLDGLPAGYLLADAALIGELREAQPPGPVGSLAVTALEACSQPDAVAWARAQATTVRPGPANGTGAGLRTTAGTVTLIGAGPGGSDLITMRGWRALHDADVVVADRLADPGLTRELRPGVLLVNAGKAPGAQQLSQEQINQVLTEHALAGQRVARLKGGDPFVFGRGGEEAAACAAAGITCTVIPGLSSALAGPALAGIPLTHREIGQSFSVVSGHLPPGHPASRVDWAALAAASDTLVLLMAVRNLHAIARHLAACGRPGTTPAAAVQDAGTAGQRVYRSTLAGLADPATAPAVRNPAVIIIGPTAGDLIPPGSPGSPGSSGSAAAT
jgi:uroporphyrin-III C-methyltransferase